MKKILIQTGFLISVVLVSLLGCSKKDDSQRSWQPAPQGPAPQPPPVSDPPADDSSQSDPAAPTPSEATPVEPGSVETDSSPRVVLSTGSDSSVTMVGRKSQPVRVNAADPISVEEFLLSPAAANLINKQKWLSSLAIESSPQARYLADLSAGEADVTTSAFLAFLANDPSRLYATDELGQGIYHQLVKANRVDLVRALWKAQYKSGLRLQDAFGRFPLHYVTSQAMAELLWEAPVRETGLFGGFKSEAVSWEVDNEGSTPLHKMVIRAEPGAIGVALRGICGTSTDLWLKGWWDSPLNLKDKDGRTPLHLAIIAKRPDVVQLLVGCSGIDYTQPDQRGRSVIHQSVIDQNFEVGSILMTAARQSRGLNTMLAIAKSQDVDGNTVLHLAYACRNEEAIRWFVEFRMFIDVENVKGQLPVDTERAFCRP